MLRLTKTERSDTLFPDRTRFRCMEIGRAEIGAVRCRHEGRLPASRIVANARSLDLEDVGAKIREKLAGPGAREDGGQFEDADAFQGTRNAQNAAMPVIARPRISPWTSWVPS